MGPQSGPAVSTSSGEYWLYVTSGVVYALLGVAGFFFLPQVLSLVFPSTWQDLNSLPVVNQHEILPVFKMTFALLVEVGLLYFVSGVTSNPIYGVSSVVHRVFFGSVLILTWLLGSFHVSVPLNMIPPDIVITGVYLWLRRKYEEPVGWMKAAPFFGSQPRGSIVFIGVSMVNVALGVLVAHYVLNPHTWFMTTIETPAATSMQRGATQLLFGLVAVIAYTDLATSAHTSKAEHEESMPVQEKVRAACSLIRFGAIYVLNQELLVPVYVKVLIGIPAVLLCVSAMIGPVVPTSSAKKQKSQ